MDTSSSPASRGLHAKEMVSNIRWRRRQGPEFLLLDKSQWPEILDRISEVSVDVKEMKR